jgi:hypothetical protein
MLKGGQTMGKYHKITDMLEGELMKIGSEGKLTNTSLEVGDKAAHFLKSIKTIEAMDESEEGNSYRYDGGNRAYDNYGYDSMSMARGRGRYARRDSMGRYADGRMSGNKQELMQEIDEMKRRVE